MRYFRSSPAVLLIAISFLMNLAQETSWVFLPLYGQTLGASNFQVGVIMAAHALAFLPASLIFGRQSDIHGRLLFVRLGLGLLALAFLTQAIVSTPLLLAASRAFIGFSLGIASAALTAYTYENQSQIGRFFSFGSLGWLFGALVGAAVRQYIPLFIISVAMALSAFVLALQLKETPGKRMQVNILPIPLLKADRKLYLAFFLRQIGAHAVFAVLPLYLVSIGADKTRIAIFDAINTGTQFIAMRLIERFEPAKVFRFGILLTIGVFLFYGVARNYLWLIPAQIGIGLAWASLFMGGLSYLLRRNTERGTVSGLLYSTIYLSGGVGPFVGGAISQAWGFNAVMFTGAGLASLGLLAFRGADKAKSLQAGRAGSQLAG
ncbi:MAG: MFS transporter [Chloroflexi bacterium]|nr:MFS transporter [Chloroflexota bacterium]